MRSLKKRGEFNVGLLAIGILGTIIVFLLS